MTSTDILRNDHDVRRTVPNEYSELLQPSCNGHALWAPRKTTGGGGALGDVGYIRDGSFWKEGNVYVDPPYNIQPLDVPAAGIYRDEHFHMPVIQSSTSSTVSFHITGSTTPAALPLTSISVEPQIILKQKRLAFLAPPIPTVQDTVSLANETALCDWLTDNRHRLDPNLVVLTHTVRSSGWIGGVVTGRDANASVSVSGVLGAVANLGVNASVELEVARLALTQGPRPAEWSEHQAEYTLVVRFVRMRTRVRRQLLKMKLALSLGTGRHPANAQTELARVTPTLTRLLPAGNGGSSTPAGQHSVAAEEDSNRQTVEQDGAEYPNEDDDCDQTILDGILDMVLDDNEDVDFAVADLRIVSDFVRRYPNLHCTSRVWNSPATYIRPSFVMKPVLSPDGNTVESVAFITDLYPNADNFELPTEATEVNARDVVGHDDLENENDETVSLISMDRVYPSTPHASSFQLEGASVMGDRMPTGLPFLRPFLRPFMRSERRSQAMPPVIYEGRRHGGAASTLSPALLHKILRYLIEPDLDRLPPSAHRKALYSAPLVNKHWNGPGNEALYKRVYLISPAARKAMLKTLRRRRVYSMLIEGISFCPPPPIASVLEGKVTKLSLWNIDVLNPNTTTKGDVYADILRLAPRLAELRLETTTARDNRLTLEFPVGAGWVSGDALRVLSIRGDYNSAYASSFVHLLTALGHQSAISVEELSLHAYQFRDAGPLDTWEGRLPSLKHLRLTHCHISPESFALLAHACVNTLEALEVVDCQFLSRSASFVRILASFTRLQKLSLGRGLPFGADMSGLTSLKVLSLDDYVCSHPHFIAAFPPHVEEIRIHIWWGPELGTKIAGDFIRSCATGSRLPHLSRIELCVYSRIADINRWRIMAVCLAGFFSPLPVSTRLTIVHDEEKDDLPALMSRRPQRSSLSTIWNRLRG